jgi:hypothetical protein
VFLNAENIMGDVLTTDLGAIYTCEISYIFFLDFVFFQTTDKI